MNETRNLCAQIPIALHDRVHEEKTRTGKTLNQYITDVLTEYYQNQDGGKNMEKKQNDGLPDTGGTVPADQGAPQPRERPHWKEAHPAAIRAGTG